MSKIIKEKNGIKVGDRVMYSYDGIKYLGYVAVIAKDAGERIYLLRLKDFKGNRASIFWGDDWYPENEKSKNKNCTWATIDDFETIPRTGYKLIDSFEDEFIFGIKEQEKKGFLNFFEKEFKCDKPDNFSTFLKPCKVAPLDESTLDQCIKDVEEIIKGRGELTKEFDKVFRGFYPHYVKVGKDFFDSFSFPLFGEKPLTKKEKARKERKELFEKLASIEHEKWSKWQKNLLSNCMNYHNSRGEITGDLIIPRDIAGRWERQANTKYEDLTEDDKEKDREQVRRYWDLIKKSE